MVHSGLDEVNDQDKQQLLNHDILDALKNYIGSDAFSDYLAEYINNTSRNLDRIEFAIAADDEPRVRHLAHRLKGSSGNIGALKLAWYCVLLEALTEEDHSSGQLKAQLNELAGVFQLTREAIESYIQEISVTQHHVA
ncbi:MAG: Hpt domain-containing protein [Gammaproteobacteria bacterium]|jgi:HPt (histidine-containing phosphotransfer) domain-containing protein